MSEDMPDPVVSVDSGAVDEKLIESMNHHLQARQLRHAKREPEAEQALRRAAALRTEALSLDPTRSSLGWRREQKWTATGRDTHEELMAFYRTQGVL